MKKTLLLLSLIFIYSCSPEFENESITITGDDYQSSYKITPPKWIQGTWISSDGYKFEFKKSDVIYNYLDGTISAQNQVKYYEIQNIDPEFIQTKTDDSYNLEYKDSPYAKKKLNFVKISDTQIEATSFRKGIYTKK